MVKLQGYFLTIVTLKVYILLKFNVKQFYHRTTTY